MGTRTATAKTVENLNANLSFSVLDAKLKSYGQTGSKYEKKKLLWIVDINDASTFVETEPRQTSDGRDFVLLWFRNPENVSDKRSIPISGDESASRFELWDCVAISDVKNSQGEISVKKGQGKVRCYAV